MSIKERITAFFGAKPTEERRIYDTDDDGKPLYKSDIIQKVMSEVERRKTERQPFEQQWILNSNFLLGNQSVDLSRYGDVNVEQIDYSDDGLSHSVFNNIAPLIETREANLRRLSFNMTVNPLTGDLDDIEKADIATSLLRYKQKASNFAENINNVISWNEICGNVFMWSWWDNHAGDYVGSETDENGETTSYYTGDVNYSVLSAFEVYPENVYKDGIASQRTMIIQQVLTVDEIYDTYGVKVDGSIQHTYSMIPVYGAASSSGELTTAMGIGTVASENSQTVTTFFEKPSAHNPQGKMIIIVGDDQIIYYGAMPYDEIPIVQFQCKEIPGHFFGKSVIQDLIPEQRVYNDVMNRIMDFINRVAINTYLIEEGSLSDTDEFFESANVPGSAIGYKRGYSKPDILRHDSVPGELYNQISIINDRMEKIAGTSQLMVYGDTPSGVTSGKAIENLRDIDTTRMSLTGDNLRNSVAALARQWLMMYHRYANIQRTLDITGMNAAGRAMTWSGSTINSYDVEFDTVNELELSEESKLQRFINLYNMGAFTDSNGVIPQRIKAKMIEAHKLNSYSELLGINDLQAQAAQRENSFFESGVIPQISPIDEHEIHLEEHMRYALQMKFTILKTRKPEYAQAFENHILQHNQIIEQQKMQMLQAMNQQ